MIYSTQHLSSHVKGRYKDQGRRAGSSTRPVCIADLRLSCSLACAHVTRGPRHSSAVQETGMFGRNGLLFTWEGSVRTAVRAFDYKTVWDRQQYPWHHTYQLRVDHTRCPVLCCTGTAVPVPVPGTANMTQAPLPMSCLLCFKTQDTRVHISRYLVYTYGMAWPLYFVLEPKFNVQWRSFGSRAHTNNFAARERGRQKEIFSPLKLVTDV